MLGIAEKPSKRIVWKGPLWLRTVSLALFAVLLLAGSAHAEVAVAGSETTPSQGATGSTQSPGTNTNLSGVNPEKVASVETPAVTVPPVAETKAPAVASGPSASETSSTAPSVPIAPEALAPAPTPISEEAPVTAPTAPVKQEGSEAGPALGIEGSAQGPQLSLPLANDPQTVATPDAAGEGAGEAPGIPIVVLNRAPALGNAGEALARSAGCPAAATSETLSALAGRISSNCTTVSPGAQVALSTSSTSFNNVAASLAAATPGGPPDGGHGGSTSGSPPVGPPTGPAPSGVSGGAGMGAAGGLAFPGFLTLAGLLLAGAPRAMRRLRLSCQPWLTACFVLIPERPG